jgi:hypothetical protein
MSSIPQPATFVLIKHFVFRYSPDLPRQTSICLDLCSNTSAFADSTIPKWKLLPVNA